MSHKKKQGKSTDAVPNLPRAGMQDNKSRKTASECTEKESRLPRLQATITRDKNSHIISGHGDQARKPA